MVVLLMVLGIGTVELFWNEATCRVRGARVPTENGLFDITPSLRRAKPPSVRLTERSNPTTKSNENRLPKGRHLNHDT